MCFSSICEPPLLPGLKLIVLPSPDSVPSELPFRSAELMFKQSVPVLIVCVALTASVNDALAPRPIRPSALTPSAPTTTSLLVRMPIGPSSLLPSSCYPSDGLTATIHNMSHRRAPVISRTNEKNCGQTAARCCLCSTTQTATWARERRRSLVRIAATWLAL